jgi:hypothetical protein
MHHTCAYNATVASAAETDITALADGVLVIQNNHFLLSRPMRLLYAAYCALLIVRARISQPSLDITTSPFIRDIALAVDFGNPPILADYHSDPLVLAALEEVRILGTNSAITSGVSLAVLGLEWQSVPAPAGQVLTIRGTGAGTLAINAWTNIGTITWQNAPQAGQFAVVGGSAFSAGAKAFRFIFPDQVPRPGGLGMILETNRTHPIFRMGELGTWGTFRNYAFPAVEMISASADVAEVVYMDIVKIG